MKKIAILLLTAFVLVFAAGCRDDASLDGLESQTKEEGAAAGETPESKALQEALNYASELDYNWVMEYAPAEGKKYTILFDFQNDNSVASDSPLSDNEKNLAIFNVVNLKEGGMVIKFDGPTMLSDEIIDAEFRERQLLVEAVTDTEIQCVGATSSKPAVLRKATSADVLKLGEKLVWLALAKQNAMQGILRASDGKFLARYAVDKNARKMNFTWIDATTQNAVHEAAGFELDVTDTRYAIEWPAVAINGEQYTSLTYTIADARAAFNVSGVKMDATVKATPDYVDKATKQYNLGGKMKCGKAQSDLWRVLQSDKFRSLLFYPYNDDIPVRVEVYMPDNTTANYLFVNDYSDNPKTAHYDTDGDWVRFYTSTRGDFLKIPSGTENAGYTIAQAAADLKPFTDFYFHADGLYTIPETDTNGKGFYLISKTTDKWVKVRAGMVQEPGIEPEPEPEPDEDHLAELITKGMKPYGTFFENEKKNFGLHYQLNPDDATADLIWITDTEAKYADGNYKDMAVNKAQYKTVSVVSTADGVITFKEPLVVGNVTYKGLTWTYTGSGTGNGTYAPNVAGLDCTIRTPMQNASHPLEYFFTYPVNKYEGGTHVFIPNSRMCMPTAGDNIPGMTGTDRYMFYPYTQPGGGTPAGPCALELFAVDKGQRIDIKSFVNGFENHPVSIAIDGFRVEDDRMIFTKGAVTGKFVDQNGAEMSEARSQEIIAPLVKLLFMPQGFHVYKAEAVSYDNGKHYFFLVSPDPAYPYWIKIREA